MQTSTAGSHHLSDPPDLALSPRSHMSGTFPLLPLRSSHCPGKVPLRNDQRGPPACSSWGWGWQPLSRAWLPKCCAGSSKTCRVDEYLLPIQLNFHEDDTRQPYCQVSTALSEKGCQSLRDISRNLTTARSMPSFFISTFFPKPLSSF